MRISTANSYDVGIDTISRRQADLADVQEQMTSLKRVNKSSDDPAAAARAERALARISRTDANQRAVNAAQVAMGQVEGAIGDATNLLQQAREALVAAGNATYTPSDRQTLAEKISNLRQQLFMVANKDDGAGSFVFGGQGSSVAPFVDAPGGVVYRGTPGQTKTEQSTGMPLTADGNAVWMAGRRGNGVFETVTPINSVTGDKPRAIQIDLGKVIDPSAYYAVPPSTYDISFDTSVSPATYSINRTPNPPAAPTTVLAQTGTFVSGQAIVLDGMSFTITGTPQAGDQFQLRPSTADLDVFEVLDKAEADLRRADRTGVQIAQFNADNLNHLDAVLGNFLSARAAAGDVLNQVDAETERLGNQKLAAQTEKSNAEDLNMVQAISEFQSKQASYDAALKTYAMVQRMSLFQYING